MALNHAPVGSTPAPEAMPPRTACGSAFVRRTARFDPGWRLAFVVERDTRWPEGPVARRVMPVRIRPDVLDPLWPGVRHSLAWTGRPGRHRERLHVTVVSAVQHASSPSSQGRFESGRSLASRTSPTWQEAPGPDPGGLRFESAVRYSWKVNRPGRRARPLSGARVTPCRSSRPPSAMEDEPARRLAPAETRAAAKAVRFEFSVLCHPLPVRTGPGSRFGE